jgi:hypothetical protein
LVLVVQRNAVIRKNQETALPPPAILNKSENSGSFQCAKGRLLELLKHISRSVADATVCSLSRFGGAPGTNHFLRRTTGGHDWLLKKALRWNNPGDKEVVASAILPV